MPGWRAEALFLQYSLSKYTPTSLRGDRKRSIYREISMHRERERFIYIYREREREGQIYI